MINWISSHVAEVSAMGTIVMNLATLVIIFFNLTQFRLNRRTLNIEVNFKVFELRKKIFRSIESFIKTVRVDKGFTDFITEEAERLVANEKFLSFKESIEDCKYLFSKIMIVEIENLLFLCEYGISTECQLQSMKENPSDWTAEDTRKIQEIANKKQEIVSEILSFDTEHFLQYLNVSNFHKDFISQSNVLPGQKFWFFIGRQLKKLWEKTAREVTILEEKNPLKIDSTVNTNTLGET